MEQWIEIFQENIYQAFFLPIGHSMTFEAMYWFHRAGPEQATALGLGVLAGSVLNWWFGQILAFIRLQRQEFFSEERFSRVGGYFRRYALWLLLFYWQPFGPLSVLAAGFFGVRFQQIAGLIAAGTLLRLVWKFPGVLS